MLSISLLLKYKNGETHDFIQSEFSKFIKNDVDYYSFIRIKKKENRKDFKLDSLLYSKFSTKKKRKLFFQI